jgi:L-glutamine-phosphate cytidylyltransferase
MAQQANERRRAPSVRPVAIILAAGAARRLAPLTDHTQKSLLPVGDRPMLAWMLEALDAVGVRDVVITVGHCADQVRALVASAPRGMAIECLDNPAYRLGSSLSLYCARDVIARAPTLIMDADVVFPRELLRRLVESPAPQALLIDRGFVDSGEEVKIYTQSERVIALGKKATPVAWDLVGEGIGFFKCGANAGPDLVHLLERVIEESNGLCEYEDALHLFVSRHYVQAVDVTGLPWTEVDFVEDLRRARAEVFPAIVRLEST